MDKKRVVIKIGTSLLAKAVSQEQGRNALESLVGDVCRFKREGHEFLLVTSGAIGAGIKKLGWSRKPDDIRKKQAAAAIGQVSLMQAYQQLFAKEKVLVAQVLLTRGDFEDRQRYLNARNTLLTLLELGVVPVINENDTVAVDEIKFGDNDQLSAMVAAKIDADILIILSDVDGLLRDADGRREVVSVVPEINAEIERLVWKGKSQLGTGGMASKIEAAKIATASGASATIANAFREGVVADILSGKNVGTQFISARRMSAKEKWILFGAIPKGEITVDAGALRALKELKRSLLPAGVQAVSGRFEKGDVVKIKLQDGEAFARGVASHASEDLQKIKGQKSGDVKKILKSGFEAEEAVHRDSLVWLR